MGKNILYQIPPGVEPVQSNGRNLLSTPEGGRVIVDQAVLALWQAVHQSTLDEVLSHFRATPQTTLHVRAGLACLAEAGLLERDIEPTAGPPEVSIHGELVSIIIVGYNSREWLENCLASIDAQTYTPIEVILVDNGSQDGSADWLAEHRPEIQLIRLAATQPLAQAINTGIKSAQGDYYLLLNPDVQLTSRVVAQMVQVLQEKPQCGAVAAKLRLLWTPAFLNGLGNLVGPLSWGTDLGLGNLDLGQFDDWQELPSACFAATLIPARAMQAVGLLDEQFPLYYEDSEWCYRARLFGYTILACPQAVVLHAISARKPGEAEQSLSPAKLRRVVFGRLNFITKINGALAFWRFLISYFLEDLARMLLFLLKRRGSMAKAHLLGWLDYLRALPDLRETRRQVQSRRCLSDRQLYALQRKAPPPLIQTGMPLLTWDVLCSCYLPLIAAGKTRQLPEFEDLPSGDLQKLRRRQNEWTLERAAHIWRIESPSALLRRWIKDLQWKIIRS
jgi:GT2 family glycosyltransferase